MAKIEKGTRVLFVCTHNSARSQMAEGLLRSISGDRFEVFSAGTNPRGVHPLAVEAMADAGIDLSAHTSKHVDSLYDTLMDYVVTVCDSAVENCPYVPARRRIIHKSFMDPSAVEGTEEVRLEAFKTVREEIREWISGSFLAAVEQDGGKG